MTQVNIPNPELRPSVDIQLHDDGTQKIIFLSCKLGVSQPLALISAVGPILMTFDGSKSFDSIVEHFQGKGVAKEVVQRVYDVLDQNFYLLTDSFLTKKDKALADFRAAKVRPASHAGRVYSSNPDDLRTYLDSLLKSGGADTNKAPGSLACLVAPHIDYRRGSACYAKAFQQLDVQKPDICILIGTSHQAGRSLFQLTRKDFECPLGILRTDTEAVDTLLKDYGEQRGLADELLHRQEHSLELQLPFLNYFCPNTFIVPILVGSFYSYLATGNDPGTDSEYQDFSASLTRCVQKLESEGKQVAFIAGIDMAHVGKNFGDEFTLEDEVVKTVETRDQEYLRAIESLSTSNIFQHVASDLDQRRICGFPTMYTVVDVLARLGKKYQAHTLSYQQAVDQESQCLVSFAAQGIYSCLP